MFAGFQEFGRNFNLYIEIYEKETRKLFTSLNLQI